MNFICELNDDQYSYDYIDHIRNVARINFYGLIDLNV